LKIGIFGGTFNPIHYGHLRAAEEVREKLGLDKILFIPSGKPPLKTRGIVEAKHRCEMARLAILNNPFFDLSDIECRLSGKSYTVNTIEELKKTNPSAEFFFILGIDAFLDIPNWWQPERLVTLAHFIIISRPGFKFRDLQASSYIKGSKTILKSLDNDEREMLKVKLKSKRDAILLKLTPIGISSTKIRRLIKLGRSVKYLLPPEVQSYIISNKLYSNEKIRVKS
jgi:nicotinate-nucleotide adenylyltransferase